jgi:uncharacterized protein DUF5684
MLALAMQQSGSGSPIGAMFGAGFLVVWLVLYVVTCLALKKICEKCGVQPGVLIWIPIAQMIPVFKAGKMNPWLILLLLVPLANLIVLIMLFVNILKTLGKNPIMVILLLIPFVNVIYLLFLGFSSPARPATAS